VDSVVTAQPPAPGAAPGTVAQGTIGGVRWTVALNWSAADSRSYTYTCYQAFTALAASAAVAPSPAFTALDTSADSQPTALLADYCARPGEDLVGYTGSNPAGFTGLVGAAAADGTAKQVMLGAVAPDVAYFDLAFTDGQHLKLIPVTLRGQRYVAWVVPAWLTIDTLTAHLGGSNIDNGQTLTAVPFEPPSGDAPQFGIWLKPGQEPGQEAPSHRVGIIGQGTGNGFPWLATAYEGTWGTCVVTAPGGTYCLQFNPVGTAVLGGWGGDPPGPVFGVAAPGVAALRVSLSDGTSVQVRPVSVGNERLFACWIGHGVAPTGWTSYDAAGAVTGSGVTVSALVTPAW
jgi:hypothetical protein